MSLDAICKHDTGPRCMACKPRATTFADNETVEVEILSEPSSTGLCKVIHHGHGGAFVRHRDRLDPLNEAARQLLRRDR